MTNEDLPRPRIVTVERIIKKHRNAAEKGLIREDKIESVDNPIAAMTDQQVIAFMTADLPMPRARQAFALWSAKIEQEQQQRVKPSAVAVRRMEFTAVVEILRAHGKGGAVKIQVLRKVIEQLLDNHEVIMPRALRDICHDALRVTDHKVPANRA